MSVLETWLAWICLSRGPTSHQSLWTRPGGGYATHVRPCRAYLPQAAALAFTLASPVWAASAYPECTKTPTESEISAAKGAFEAGQVSFHEGDYERAVLY